MSSSIPDLAFYFNILLFSSSLWEYIYKILITMDFYQQIDITSSAFIKIVDISSILLILPKVIFSSRS